MPVGDVNSTARGSGARYNDGKPDLSLIPLRMIAESSRDPFRYGEGVHLPGPMYVLFKLGEFQVSGRPWAIDDALRALANHWRDCARVFEYGKAKYAAWNWAKGMAWSIPLACGARHALAILEGEELDPESGLPHVGHLMANLVMLRHFVNCYPEGNDLPPPELFERPAMKYGESPISSPEVLRDLEVVADISAGGVLAELSRYSPEGFTEVLSTPEST